MGQLVKNLKYTDVDGTQRQITDENGRFIDHTNGPASRPHM